MARQVGATRGAKKRADVLFSKIVRARGACQRCGESDYTKLQCAHIISRRFANTRCDEDNAFCLCAGCHMFFTDHPVDFADFVHQHMTAAYYAELVARSQTTSKVVWEDVVRRLKVRAQQLELV